MRCKRKIYLLLSGCILLLSGCGRIVDWAKESFNQGQDLDNYAKIPRQFLRSVIVYDQFETLGVFDALWLSDSVRTEYTQLHAYKHGKSAEHKKAFLRRQLEENKHYIVFYVLSLFGKSLDIEDAAWTLFLEIDGLRYAPIAKPEAIELAPEYTFFFGKRLSKFKVPYLVRFNSFDIENKLLIDEKVKEIHLVFRSAEKEVRLTWDLTSLPVNNMHDEKIGAT